MSTRFIIILIIAISIAVVAKTSSQTNTIGKPMSPNLTVTTPPGFDPAPVVPMVSEEPARLIVDSPLPEQLAKGYVVIRYHAEHMRILPVYGEAALGVSPRIGHLHITVDDLPWHWLDASGSPISINGLPPGPHKLLIELQDPTHHLVDSQLINFEISKTKS